MTGSEDKPQQIVADVIVERGFEIRHRLLLPGYEFATEFLVLVVDSLVTAQVIDGAMLRGRHQPGSRITRHARSRPLFKGGHQRVLREFLGDPNVAHDARKTGDETG